MELKELLKKISICMKGSGGNYDIIAIFPGETEKEH
jgi:hypothetical protein